MCYGSILDTDFCLTYSASIIPSTSDITRGTAESEAKPWASLHVIVETI